MGSVDFLGNPMGLINDVSSGLEGLVKRGNVGGLFMNVAHGVSDSAAKVSTVSCQMEQLLQLSVLRVTCSSLRSTTLLDSFKLNFKILILLSGRHAFLLTLVLRIWQYINDLLLYCMHCSSAFKTVI